MAPYNSLASIPSSNYTCGHLVKLMLPSDRSESIALTHIVRKIHIYKLILKVRSIITLMECFKRNVYEKGLVMLALKNRKKRKKKKHFLTSSFHNPIIDVSVIVFHVVLSSLKLILSSYDTLLDEQLESERNA